MEMMTVREGHDANVVMRELITFLDGILRNCANFLIILFAGLNLNEASRFIHRIAPYDKRAELPQLEITTSILF